jgi:hypothetical protein
MAKKQDSSYKSARNLPCIGIWNRTASHEPTAGNTLVGLWQEDDGADRIEFFCAFYESASGEAVDPDDLLVDDEGFSEPYTITYRSRQGGNTAFWDEEIDPPDYWAECRLLIPAF